MGEVKEVVDAEKGKNLSLKNLHIRLRVIEVIMLLSLVLNLALWFFAGKINSKVDSQPENRPEAQAPH